MKKWSLLCVPLLALSGLALAGDDAVIAEVYEHKVTLKDLALPTSMVEDSRKTLSATEFASWEQDSRRQLLAYGVMQEARKRFLAETKLTPTEDEITGYIESQNRMMAADAKKRVQDREKLQQELQQPGLSKERRTFIENDIAAMDELSALLKSDGTGAQSDEDKAAQRSVATMMVSNWKFNQGLYHKYGGRVVFQQAGLEPIDANKAFLDELKASGDYTINDPAYQHLFKESDDYFNKKFDPVDKVKADEYFASPWWLKADKPAE